MRGANYTVVMKVLDACKTIYSRLKLQKMFYILRSLGYPVSERFKYKQYGPYSHELASEIETSVRLGYLSEKEVSRETAEEGGNPYLRYDIRITKKGKEFLHSAAEEWTEELHLDRVGEVSKVLNRSQPKQLELLATLMYVHDVGVKGDIGKYVRRLKPKFSKAQIDRGLKRVKKIRDELALVKD